MVDVRNKRCVHKAATRDHRTAWKETRRLNFARSTPGREWWASSARGVGTQDAVRPLGTAGKEPRRLCSAPKHAREGMVDVIGKRCGYQGCNKIPSYGVEGTEKLAQYAREGMVESEARGVGIKGDQICVVRRVEGTKGRALQSTHQGGNG